MRQQISLNKNIMRGKYGIYRIKNRSRNPVIEAYRSGKTIDKLFVLTDARMALSKRSHVRPGNSIPLSVTYPKNVWISFLRHIIIRE